MPELLTTRGRIVDLRRHTNVHLYGRRPLGPTDRYELWVRQRGGRERKFTIHTRTMPAHFIWVPSSGVSWGNQRGEWNGQAAPWQWTRWSP